MKLSRSRLLGPVCRVLDSFIKAKPTAIGDLHIQGYRRFHRCSASKQIGRLQSLAVIVKGRARSFPTKLLDPIRERVSNNIGEAGDEQKSRMAVTQHIVVTISADTPIYVVLEQAPKSNGAWIQLMPRGVQRDYPASAEELRQLLQLQHKLNHTNATTR